MSGYLARILLGLFGLFLALAVGEVALRLLPLPDLTLTETFQAVPDEVWRDPNWLDIPWGRGYRQNPVVGYEHSDDVDLRVRIAEHADGRFRFRTNNLGLRRDAKTSVEKPAGQTRLLVLGDSHTDGFVDNAESFSTLLETRLGPASNGAPGSVQVLNAGVAGYSPAEQYLWYEENGARLSPDVVISVFYVGNDALDLLNPRKANVDPETGTPRPPTPASRANQGPLEDLRLIQVGRNIIQSGPLSEPWRRLGLPGAATEVGGYPTDILIKVLRRCFGCYFQSLQQAARAHRAPGEVPEAVERAAALYARWDATARSRGSRLIVAVLPTRVQVEPGLARPDQQAVATVLGLDENDLRLDDQVAGTMLTRLRANAIPFTDLRPPLAAASEQPNYYSVDWHLNPAGHRVVAAALAQALAEQHLWPVD